MRCSFRIVFNTLTVLSLVLAAGVVWLWVQSYSTAYEASYLGQQQGVRALMNCGSLMIDYVTEDTSVFGHGSHFYVRSERQRISVSAYVARSYPTHLFRFGVRDHRISLLYNEEDQPLSYTRERGITFPLWAPTLTLVMIGGTGILMWRRRNLRTARGRSNLCPTCNYDLRATPDRCPECGAVPKGATV